MHGLAPGQHGDRIDRPRPPHGRMFVRTRHAPSSSRDPPRHLQAPSRRASVSLDVTIKPHPSRPIRNRPSDRHRFLRLARAENTRQNSREEVHAWVWTLDSPSAASQAPSPSPRLCLVLCPLEPRAVRQHGLAAATPPLDRSTDTPPVSPPPAPSFFRYLETTPAETLDFEHSRTHRFNSSALCFRYTAGSTSAIDDSL
jgi:hypothetical protein